MPASASRALHSSQSSCGSIGWPCGPHQISSRSSQLASSAFSETPAAAKGVLLRRTRQAQFPGPGQTETPYERLLYDALTGDDRLFVRQDAVEQSWRIIQPLVAYPPPVRPYPVDSWGPPQADALLSGYPPWQPLWLPEPST